MLLVNSLHLHIQKYKKYTSIRVLVIIKYSDMSAGVCFPSDHTLLLPDMNVERSGSARLVRAPVFVVPI